MRGTRSPFLCSSRTNATPPTRGTTLSSALEAASQPPQTAFSTSVPEAHLSEPCSLLHPSDPFDSSTNCQQSRAPLSLQVHEASCLPKPRCASRPPDPPPRDAEAVLHQIGTSQPSHVTDSAALPGSLAPFHKSPASQSRDRWFIGRGKALLSRAAIFRQEQGVAVEMTHRVYRHPSLHALTNEWATGVFLQHLPSIIAAHVLGPRPCERILDMCASPGGKTTAIAILMQDRGEIVALDRSQTKVRQIESLAAQMGLTCIKAFKMDATCCVQDRPTPDIDSAKPDGSFESDGRALLQVLAHETCGRSAADGISAAAQATGSVPPIAMSFDTVATSAESIEEGISERLHTVRVAECSGCSSKAESGDDSQTGLGSMSTSVSSIDRELEMAGDRVHCSAAPTDSFTNSESALSVPGQPSARKRHESRQERNGGGQSVEKASSSRRPEAAARREEEDRPSSQTRKNRQLSDKLGTESRDTDRGAAQRRETGLINRDVSEPNSVIASAFSEPPSGSPPDTAHRSSFHTRSQSPKPLQSPPVGHFEATSKSNPHAAEPQPPASFNPSEPSTGGDRRGTPLERRAARQEARWLRSNQKRVRPEKLEAGSFDRVLLDAPCSALGLRPRLFVRGVSLQSLRQDGVYKRRFLDQAVRLVKPGGVIVYSTCTFNPGENEALVRYALDTYPCLRLVPQEPRLGGPGLVGGGDVFDGTGYREWLREGEQNLVQRFNPDSPLDTIGFFIAKFDKRS